MNVPWLFDWSHALVHKAAYDLAPADPTDRGGLGGPGRPGRGRGPGRPERAGAAAHGPGLAGRPPRRARGAGGRPSAWCSPWGRSSARGRSSSAGSPGRRPVVGRPATWGLLLLALEVWLLHRAVDLGRRGAAFALIPLFVLWANVDESFLIGLIVLAACVGRAGSGREPGEGADRRSSLPAALAVLAACAAACLVNPSVFQVYRAAADPFLGALPAGDRRAHARPALVLRPGHPRASQAGRRLAARCWRYYLVVVAVGLGSFYLNRRRFSLGRFLVYAAAAVLWGVLKRYGPEFAVVFAATLALNGQEWYHDRFGTAGRVGAGWSLWSVGGRAVTILVIFLCVAKVLLGGLPVPGFAATEVDGQFGFGYDRDDFAFEAADFLKTAAVPGQRPEHDQGRGRRPDLARLPRAQDLHRQPPAPVPRRRLQPAPGDPQGPEHRRRRGVEAAARPVQDQRRDGRAVDVAEDLPGALAERELGAVLRRRGGRPVRPGRRARRPTWRSSRRTGSTPRRWPTSATKPTPSADRPPTPVSWMDNVFQTRRRRRPPAARPRRPGTGSTAPSRRRHRRPALPDPARCLLADPRGAHGPGLQARRHRRPSASWPSPTAS